MWKILGPPHAKKNELKPHLNTYWCIPPKANAEFVAAMEDCLDVYHRPYDESKPLVCLDEASKQLVAETRPSIPVEPGPARRVDAEYRRCGTTGVFMLNAPLEGKRHVRLRERRTRKDFAEVIRELCDELYPEAEKIVLVMDNLNMHNIASLYEAFPAVEARRLAEKLEIYYTPKHGSWLGSPIAKYRDWGSPEHGGDRTEHLHPPMHERLFRQPRATGDSDC